MFQKEVQMRGNNAKLGKTSGGGRKSERRETLNISSPG